MHFGFSCTGCLILAHYCGPDLQLVQMSKASVAAKHLCQPVDSQRGQSWTAGGLFGGKSKDPCQTQGVSARLAQQSWACEKNIPHKDHRWLLLPGHDPVLEDESKDDGEGKFLLLIPCEMVSETKTATFAACTKITSQPTLKPYWEVTEAYTIMFPLTWPGVLYFSGKIN